MEKQTVYIPVDAIKGAEYFILCKSNLSPINQLLEKKKNVYVLTPQELEKAIGDAFDAGIKYEAQSLFEIIDGKSPNKEQYLNNLKQP